MSPDGMKLWIYFITAWIAFWATAGGVVCKTLGRPVWKGIIFGGILAPVGILLVIVTHEDRK